MEGFFEKFGLYDFFSMFVAGIISESIAIIVAYKCFSINVLWIFCSSLLFLVIGYFIGLILHEIEGQAEKKIFKHTFSRSVLSKKDDFFKNDYDKEMLEKVKVHILGDKEKYTDKDEEYITSVCCNELQINNAVASSDRLKTQSEMSLSICIATIFIIVIIVIGIFIGKTNTFEGFMVSLLLLIISIIFYVRSKRMQEHYIRCLIRTYAVLNNLERNRKGE